MALMLRLCRLAGLASALAASEGETAWSVEANNALAEADRLQQQKRWADAITYYKRVLAVSPNPPNFQKYIVLNNLGWSMYHTDRWAEAEHYYHLALAAVPNKPPTDHAHINLATLYTKTHRPAEAVASYRAALSMTASQRVQTQLGRVLIRNFQVGEAVETLKEALSAWGSDGPAAQEAHRELGTAYAARRNWGRASHHLIRAVDLGLPTNSTGCAAARWSVVEGWGGVHPFGNSPALSGNTAGGEPQVSALTITYAHARRALAALEGPPPSRGPAAEPLRGRFVDPLSGVAYDEAASEPFRLVMLREVAREGRGEESGPTSGPELVADSSRWRWRDGDPPHSTCAGRRASSSPASTPAVDCPRQVSSTDRGLLTHAGEHTASGFLPSSFGAKDADNALDSESTRGEKWLEGDALAKGGGVPPGLSAHPRHDGSGDTFAVMDVRSGGADGWQLRVELASKLLLLLLSLDTAPCRHGVVSGWTRVDERMHACV